MIKESDIEEYSIYESLLDFNPNLILYGPPGTGKTYTAQKIIEYLETKREKTLMTFEQVQQNGRAEFVTFHQSYSYEDFVEGLRPQLANEKDEDTSAASLQYIVNDGILKKSCEQSRIKPAQTGLQ